MSNNEEDKRLEAILDGASKLPVNLQVCILNVIEGILRARGLHEPMQAMQRCSAPTIQPVEKGDIPSNKP